ncbi:MAG: NAD(P)/FAD-dependent oxidoreductase [Prevotella sp.]|nr:NAD(P)/FAD-dependent oxidoreductase [Prevotella sp.]
MMYDVIIIGSGLGGLICARQLAKQGRSVLVLERQTQPGGCLQSYRRGDFEFDTGLHYVGGLAEGQPLYEAFQQLGLMQLPWVRLDADGFDRVTIGRQTFPLCEGFGHFASVLGEYFPQEKKALGQYADMLRHLPSMEESAEVNAYDWLTSLFHDPLLVNVLSATAMKMELKRESLPLFNYAHSMSSYIQSSWRLRGSGNMIVASLVNDIKSLGGEVVCRAEVRELVEKEGRIVAAKCPNGKTYEGRMFISDVHPQLTFGWLKDSYMLKGIFRRRIQALENTFGIFTASLVLKPDTLPYFNHNKYVFRKANVWTFHEDIGGVGGVMVSCRVPESGEHTRQIDLLTPMPWILCKHWEDTVVGRRGEIYELQKERIADDCIRLAERVIPGLRDMVEKRYTSTPLTWRDYTLSPCGSAFGVRKDCRQPLVTMLSPKTPIPNLFLTGQSLVLHGLEGVTMTAFKTLETIKNKKI